MEVVKLIDFIDFEDSIAKAIEQGYHPNEDEVSILINYDQIAAVKDALDNLIRLGQTITKGMVIDSYESLQNVFVVKLEKPL
jgi:hypothetical protein